MPLHSDDPMFMRLMLDGFDHAIGGDSRNAQAVPKLADGLMMRGVNLDVESALTFGQAGNGRELSEFAATGDPCGMDGIGCIRRKTFLAVLDVGMQFAGDVLIERAAEADVQALAAIANGEDGFAGGEGVLQDREIRFLAIRIGGMSFFVACSVVKRRVNVRWSPREDKSVQVLDLGGKLFGREVQRNGDGLASCFLDGAKVILELAGDPIGLFVGRAPGDAHTWLEGSAQLRISRGHGTPNRSIWAGG